MVPRRCRRDRNSPASPSFSRSTSGAETVRATSTSTTFSCRATPPAIRPRSPSVTSSGLTPTPMDSRIRVNPVCRTSRWNCCVRALTICRTRWTISQSPPQRPTRTATTCSPDSRTAITSCAFRIRRRCGPWPRLPIRMTTARTTTATACSPAARALRSAVRSSISHCSPNPERRRLVVAIRK